MSAVNDAELIVATRGVGVRAVLTSPEAAFGLVLVIVSVVLGATVSNQLLRPQPRSATQAVAQQRDMADFIRSYEALLRSVEVAGQNAASRPDRLHAVRQALRRVRLQLALVRPSYGSGDLAPTAAVQSLIDPLMADLQVSLDQAVVTPGSAGPGYSVPAAMAHDLTAAKVTLMAIERQIRTTAAHATAAHAGRFGYFTTALIGALTALAALVIGVAVLLGRQLTLRLQLADTRRYLAIAVDNIADGFLLYDRDDRVVLASATLSQRYPELAQTVYPGARFAEVVDTVYRGGLVVSLDGETEHGKLAALRAARRHRLVPFELCLRDGRVYKVVERLTDEHGIVAVYTDVTTVKQFHQQISFQATHDRLTGLGNRSAFHGWLEHAVARAHQHASKLAVLLFDLDRFKAVNDSLGQAAGDQLLIEVAQRIQASLRNADSAARLGGDEFAAIIESIDSVDEVAAIAGRWLTRLNRPVTIDGNLVPVSASMGIAVFPDDAGQASELLQRADTARGQAKRRGRNHYQRYDDDSNIKLIERRALEHHLSGALSRAEFEVHYQPQVESTTQRLVGLEALLRWHSPDLGEVAPDRFIPLAEEMGLIAELGAWALRQACTQNQTWRRQGLNSVPVVVNMSPLQFNAYDMVELVTQVLDECGLATAGLELEITESALMEGMDNFIGTSTLR